MTAGLVGLVVTSTFTLISSIQQVSREGAELECQMTSVERALEYTKIRPEAPLDCPGI
jgi:hypothetical protein